jgi:hypothetical protein
MRPRRALIADDTFGVVALGDTTILVPTATPRLPNRRHAVMCFGVGVFVELVMHAVASKGMHVGKLYAGLLAPKGFYRCPYI